MAAKRYDAGKIKAARKRAALACPEINYNNSTRRAPSIPSKVGGARCNYGYARPGAMSLSEAIAWSDDAHLWAWSRQV